MYIFMCIPLVLFSEKRRVWLSSLLWESIEKYMASSRQPRSFFSLSDTHFCSVYRFFMRCPIGMYHWFFCVSMHSQTTECGKKAAYELILRLKIGLWLRFDVILNVILNSKELYKMFRNIIHFPHCERKIILIYWYAGEYVFYPNLWVD